MPVTYNPDAAARLKHVASLASRAASAIASIASALADIDYTGGDNSISVNGYSIAVNLSTIEGNLLALEDDGLFVGSDDSKVDKVTGKQLSTEDYTTTEKTKLSGISAGAQVNVIETINVDGSALSVADKIVNISLSGKVDKVDGKQLSTNDFTDAYKNKLDAITSALQYRGSVSSLSALPNNPSVGDVYNVSTAGGTDENGQAVKAGDNVAYSGTGWDVLSGTVDLSGKVDKVSNAVAGNFAIFGASGVIVDSGFAFATDTEFNAMLDEYFPVSGTSSVGG